MRCLSQSRCLVLQWRNYCDSQLIRRMFNLTFPESPCLEWVRLCRDCTRPFWPRMVELILSWENIIVMVLHLFTGTNCCYQENFLDFSMYKIRQLSIGVRTCKSEKRLKCKTLVWKHCFASSNLVFFATLLLPKTSTKTQNIVQTL